MPVRYLVAALCISWSTSLLTAFATAAEQSVDPTATGKCEASDIGYTCCQDYGCTCCQDCGCNHDCDCGCSNECQRILGMLPSDHCFDRFISPLSNPFFFEDPRIVDRGAGYFSRQQPARLHRRWRRSGMGRATSRTGDRQLEHHCASFGILASQSVRRRLGSWIHVRSGRREIQFHQRCRAAVPGLGRHHVFYPRVVGRLRRISATETFTSF